MRTSTIRRQGLLLLALGMALLLALTLGPVVGQASSHREAPLIAGEPQLDNTDVYAFVSPDDPNTVTLIGNWVPLEEPTGGPNFYPFADGARYDINIDNDHDAVADITYRWVIRSEYRNEETFLYNTGQVTSLDDENLNYRQFYTLERIEGQADTGTALVEDGRVAPSHVGDASIPDYAALRNEAITTFEAASGTGQTYVGQADEPFFLDLRVFDLLYGGDLSEVGNQTTAGYNVNTIAIQVPKDDVVLDGDASANPIIGVWSDTQARSIERGPASNTPTGEFVQVSRLGMPLVNEVVIPIQDKDNFNSSQPDNDQQFAGYVQDPELPKLIEAIYGIPAPEPPRDDLVSVFLTGVEGLNKPEDVTASEQIRLNTSIAPSDDPDRMGVLAGDNAGFPNGRRLGDDVVDIALQVMEGELRDNPNDLGDGVNSNDVAFSDTFPYLALPHSGSDTAPSGTTGAGGGAGENGNASDAPKGGVDTGVNTLVASPWLLAFGGGLALVGAAMAGGAVVAARRRTDT